YRIEFAGRARDDTKNLGRRRLLFERFRQIVSALAQLREQPRGLRGDPRLLGQALHQGDLPVGKRQPLPTKDVDRTYQLGLFEYWHTDEGLRAAQLECGSARPVLGSGKRLEHGLGSRHSSKR